MHSSYTAWFTAYFRYLSKFHTMEAIKLSDFLFILCYFCIIFHKGHFNNCVLQLMFVYVGIIYEMYYSILYS